MTGKISVPAKDQKVDQGNCLGEVGLQKEGINFSKP
jgi:hypothetical protein